MQRLTMICGTSLSQAVLVWVPAQDVWWGTTDENWHLRVYVRGAERANMTTRHLGTGFRWMAVVLRTAARAEGLHIADYVRRFFPGHASALLLALRVQDHPHRLRKDDPPTLLDLRLRRLHHRLGRPAQPAAA